MCQLKQSLEFIFTPQNLFEASCLLLKSGVIDIMTYDIFINEKA